MTNKPTIILDLVELPKDTDRCFGCKYSVISITKNKKSNCADATVVGCREWLIHDLELVCGCEPGYNVLKIKLLDKLDNLEITGISRVLQDHGLSDIEVKRGKAK